MTVLITLIIVDMKVYGPASSRVCLAACKRALDIIGDGVMVSATSAPLLVAKILPVPSASTKPLYRGASIAKVGTVSWGKVKPLEKVNLKTVVVMATMVSLIAMARGDELDLVRSVIRHCDCHRFDFVEPRGCCHCCGQ